MRRLIHLTWILPTLLVGLLAGLAWLAMSEGGLQFLAAHLQGKLGPVQLQLRGVRGTLVGGVHVDLLVIDHRRAHIEVEGADGRLTLLPLLWQTIRVPDAHIARLLVRVLPFHGPDDHKPPEFLPQPLHIDAEHVRVDRGQLIVIGGDEYDVSALSAAGEVDPARIRVRSSSMQYLATRLETSGDVHAAEPLQLAGTTHFYATPKDQPVWTGDARFQGDLKQLQIQLAFGAPFTATILGSAADLTDRWHWTGAANLTHLELGVWGAGNALGTIHGQLQLNGDHSGFHARGRLEPPGLKAGPLDTQFDGHYTAGTLYIEHASVQHPAGALVRVEGRVLTDAPTPVLDLAGTWMRFRWPLATANADVYSDRGSFTLHGWHRFALRAAGELHTPVIASMPVRVAGQLDGAGLDAPSVELEPYGAHAALAASVDWSGVPVWQAHGSVTGLEVERWSPGIDGHLNFLLDAHGRDIGAAGAFEAHITELAGTVRGQRASGHATIANRGQDWQFSDVQLLLGATHVALDGHVGNRVDLAFDVNASDLALLYPGTTGQLRARGTWRGVVSDPTLLGTLDATHVGAAGMNLDALHAQFNFDPYGSGRVDWSLQLHGLQSNGRHVDDLTAQVTGTAAQHTVTLHARAEDYTATALGTGHWEHGHWQGTFAEATLEDRDALHMKLEAPASLDALWSVPRIDLSEACLHGDVARLCFNMLLAPDQNQLSVNATNMPMTALTAGVSTSTDFDGALSVALEGGNGPGKPWHGSLHAQLTDAAIHHHLRNARLESLRLGSGSVDAQLTEQALTGKLVFDAASAGHVAASIHAEGEGSWRSWPLTGRLDMTTDALGFVDSYASDIDRASGHLSAAVTLGGVTAAPTISGHVKISDGRVDNYQYNLSLREVALDAAIDDDQLKLNGTARMGPDGHATVDGSLRWRQWLPYGNLHFTGSDLRLISLPEARVDVSPDVSFDVEGRHISATGQIVLPYARLEQPQSLTDAIRPSSDETIMGAVTGTPTDPFTLSYRIRMVLGDRVTIRSQGLSGRLTGALTVTSNATGIDRGSGTLNILEGHYRFYGRELDIESGRLSYDDTLLDNPQVDVRAVKVFPNIKAIVNVRGPLNHLNTSFESDPPVDRSQILSLLVAGGSLQSVQGAADPLSQATNARNQAMLQALGIIGQQVGNRFNIDANIEQDLTNETSLVIGRYLSPRLYISYGTGLTSALNVVKLRYTLGDHWTIKVEYGTQRSGDLLYTIER